MLRQSGLRSNNCSNCDKMDSDDSWGNFVVKIEIDVAEESPVSWKTEEDEQGQ